jgi:hypothetical protein
MRKVLTAGILGLFGYFLYLVPVWADMPDSFDAMKIISGQEADINASKDISGDGKIGLPEAIYSLQVMSDQRAQLLSITPLNQEVDSGSGTTTFEISNAGAGTLTWEAVVTSGSDWLSITSGVNGTDSGTLICEYQANPEPESRTGMIQITSPEASQGTIEVSVVQAPLEISDQAITYDWSRKVEEMVEAFDPTVLNLTDSRGNRYTLHIPLEADLFGTDVAMVAVQSIENFPMSGGLLGGVGLLPDGLMLIEPATLVVKPADSSAVDEWLHSSPDRRLLGYMHAEDGEYFHYYPYTIHGDEIHFTVPCFRGFGLGLATGDDITQHLARPAMTASIEANRASAPVFGDLAAKRVLINNPSASFSDAEKTTLTHVYNRWFDQHVEPLCNEGESDVGSLDQAIIEYLQWVAAVTQSGTDHTQRKRQALDTIERGMSNYLLRVQSSARDVRESSLPIASAQDQSQMEQGRIEFYASFAGFNGLDILDRILADMKSLPPFILESTITFNEGTESEIRVSVKSDPVFLSWRVLTRPGETNPIRATMVGTAAIRHADYYIWAEDEECYDVTYNLTPGTLNVELFPPKNQTKALPDGRCSMIPVDGEEWVQRSFVVISIMPLQSSFTISDICPPPPPDPPPPPITSPPAPVWLGSFTVFHQYKLFSGGMLFTNWQHDPRSGDPFDISGILEFDQVGEDGERERTTMRY